jgi:DNA-binding transcriptional regulator YiaG
MSDRLKHSDTATHYFSATYHYFSLLCQSVIDKTATSFTIAGMTNIKRTTETIQKDRASDKFLTALEVATLLGVSVATVRRWRVFGIEGPKYCRIGCSAIRYRPEGGAAYVESRLSGGRRAEGVQ